MANEENLIKYQYGSGKEPREEGRKGGKKSGEVRKAKKSLKEKLEVLHEFLTKKVVEGMTDKEAREKILEYGYVPYTLIRMINDPKASDADKLRAIKEFNDRTEGKAKEFVEHSGEINGTMDIIVGDIKLEKDGSDN